ncbi:MAG: chemotaxis protein CheA [Gammaproteobacteria bacterium]|nr:chemotaxis protein CheA [Gammaproteobacteria bacterium]
MSIDLSQFQQVFFEESFEGLEIMETSLLGLDPNDVDDEEINTIFRAAHSIKGGSGTFGFSAVADFTHVMETLLNEMRDGRRAVTAESVDILLQSVDVLRDMLAAADEEREVDVARVAAQKQVLENVLNPDGEDESTAGEDKVENNAPPESDEKPIGWHIIFRPLPQILKTGNDPMRILRELMELGEIHIEVDDSDLPDLSNFDPELCYLAWDITLMTEKNRAEVDEIFAWVEDDCELIVHEILADKSAVDQQTPVLKVVAPVEDRRVKKDRRDKEPKKASGSSSIRVDITKIDELINMVGELVITQSMLSLLGETFEMEKLEQLNDGLSQLERHTRNLQESVMQIRMLPISFTFNRFPRLVHDLSAKLGKKIDLQVHGETTEVDKTVIEKIGDPLVHLVRNSLDHGIEMPADRLASGKSEVGVISLNAFHQGGNIVLEIRDDGKGLDRAVLVKKALEKGLIDGSQELTDRQVYELIFHPGFSTAEKVSDVSGRGVGMDVVRKNINELGGSITIESELGQGTAIIIRLPLTLAILDGQTVQVADETYIVPLGSIVESIQVKEQQVSRVVGRGETFKLRDEYLPIVRLHDVFGIKNSKAKTLQEGLLVIVEGESHRCGLFVDDLLGQQQVVIKSLEENYQRVNGISGATILGDGSVALILDIPSMMRLADKCDLENRVSA